MNVVTPLLGSLQAVGHSIVLQAIGDAIGLQAVGDTIALQAVGDAIALQAVSVITLSICCRHARRDGRP